MTATAAILPIRDEATYEATLAEVRRLWSSAGGTPEGDRLEVLTILVEAYEQEHHPIGLPDPIEAIKARMGTLACSVRTCAPCSASAAAVFPSC
jgi:HTH-type transcriptional regulator/antitoxin HigA